MSRTPDEMCWSQISVQRYCLLNGRVALFRLVVVISRLRWSVFCRFPSREIVDLASVESFRTCPAIGVLIDVNIDNRRLVIPNNQVCNNCGLSPTYGEA